MLTSMSSLAQEESRSLITNAKCGITHRFQNGEIMINHNRFLSYTKNEEGKLIIDSEDAEVVKRIYREYLEGASLLEIARGLERDKIITAAGKEKWRSETIKKSLKKKWIVNNMALCHSIMLKIVMKPLFQENFICRFKKRWL